MGWLHVRRKLVFLEQNLHFYLNILDYKVYQFPHPADQKCIINAFKGEITSQTYWIASCDA